MAVSMHDVARAAGVSQRTVSNVVNNYEHVRPETRQRVLDAMAMLGYVPNAAARSLRSARTGLIALVVPDFRARIFADLADPVVREAGALGYTVLIELTESDREHELQVLTGGRNQLTDGAIMMAMTLRPDDGQRRRADYPIVLMGDQVLEGQVCHVGIPNREASLAVARHLVDTGRRRLMLLGYDPDGGLTARMRARGFLEGVAQAGLSADETLLVRADWTREGGRQAIERHLGSGLPMPDAIFAMNDSIALGALRALQARGVRVPKEVALVGFDDVEEAGYSTPSLTSVSPDVESMAANAVAMLHEQITGKPSGRKPHIMVDFHLKVRESSQ
ncbi:LacI family DNA-binding transcriptional regulator [Nonomuraea diastatica]|uniref:LacI family transcriptional regulator n=1 Tax=Nonomuraea diastatica TaxID=1848329 RepID=A0A4R4X595_9ACTN|nr:LacI family DNA-binding transcriptional regulator [Nonomuraea diastatica]TDD25503.1 LacI family transcriptional regulator [Nonomuraea diastatica]